MAEVWAAASVNKSLQQSGAERLRFLKHLNSLTYPLADLPPRLVEDVLKYHLTSPEAMSADEITAFAQLVSIAVARQHVTLGPTLHAGLLQFMMLHMTSIPDPTELMYASAELVEQTSPSAQTLSELLSTKGPLNTVLTKFNSPVTSKRGSLRCIAVLCCSPEVPQPQLHDLLAGILVILADMKDQLYDGSKYLLSLLKTLHSLVLSFASLKSSQLMPKVLSVLKSYMCTGLPTTLGIRSQTTPSSGDTHMASDDITCVTSFSSDSELSDSEPVGEKAKLINSRIRYQVHVTLAAIFQSLDHQTAFSCCQSFLSNPLQQQSLLYCILKDPTSKCRSGAVTVLVAMLIGSKPYFGPAKDGTLTSQPYTPYSYTLGTMLKELHWCLLLAATTETNSLTLTQIIKCLSTLVASTPYHHLSDSYVTRILGALQSLLNHRDTDVHVAVLTCYGSVFSLVPQHVEVLQWLSTCRLHIVGHCSQVLSSHGSGLAVKTEALQVLTSLMKFYFSAVKDNWEDIGQLYFIHLASATSLQLHALKLLEELCRALSDQTELDTSRVVTFWNQLLTGPLPLILQDTALQSVCSQGCSLLSTIGDHVYSRLPEGMRMLVLTLPLGLCREAQIIHHSICASAVRVLGVFVTYESLKTDLHFIVDCHSVILLCLSCSSLLVRVQASWSLGNLTDTLSGVHDIPLELLSPLFGAIRAAMLDNDKVRCNAVRASGNLLRNITSQALVTCRAQVTDLCALLARAVVSGGMKCRWNACYACHSAFLNCTLINECTDDMEQLTNSLCSAICLCKNFKVRINAALALGTPDHYGSNQFQSVWAAIMDGLSNSEDEIQFSEYKHAVALKTQLCTTMMHMLTVMQPAHCKGKGLYVPVEHLRKTLAEFLKSEKALPEVLHNAEANLELLKGSSDVQHLLGMFATLKITDTLPPPCE